jgi:C-terminal processing protease CtpA/Prc
MLAIIIMLLVFPAAAVGSFAWAADLQADGKQNAAADSNSEQTKQPQNAPLSGSISRSDFSHDVEQRHAENQAASGTVQSDKSEKPKFHIFSNKHKYVMTADDYRNLQFGVTGFESTLLSGKYQVVTRVFHNCPAEAAGIMPGDRVIQANDHVFTEHDAQREVWKYMDGRAGTDVEITILRKRQYLVFHLIRINIEDIPDPHLRWTYEHLVHTLGTPGY